MLPAEFPSVEFLVLPVMVLKIVISNNVCFFRFVIKILCREKLGTSEDFFQKSKVTWDQNSGRISLVRGNCFLLTLASDVGLLF